MHGLPNRSGSLPRLSSGGANQALSHPSSAYERLDETLCVSYQGEAGFCLACLDMATLSRAIITILLSQDLTKAKEQADC